MAKPKKKPARVVPKKPAVGKARAKAASPANKTRKGAKAPKKAAAKRAKAAQPKTRGVPIEALGGKRCDFLSAGYGELDLREEDIARALRSFIALKPSALAAVEEHVFRYYLDCKDHLAPGDPGHVEIGSAKDVWKHVDFGFEATVRRRKHDGKVYVSLECNCDWEPEHGLQLVFEEGRRVSKVGPFDDHLTTSDAYGDPSLEGVVYRPRARA